ncbi:MAG: MotA/TolQ/ExbB proton channel family protein [Pseudomonadota bacterium]
MLETFEAIRRFLDTAGPVLWLIGFTAMLLGAMIIERFWYFRREFTMQSDEQVASWQERSDRHSWHALRIRDALISEADTRLNCTLPLIKMLVGICPLLGLLGTVTGMMEVFDIIGMLGTGNARAMASGISKATIPTMAGMVVAIPGLYFSAELQRKIKRRLIHFADCLTIA